MTQMNEQIRQEALEWALASQEADFAGWQALIEWLETDPRHSEAYDAAVAAGNWMAELASAAAHDLPRAANDDASAAPDRRRSWRVGYLALAAAITALLLIPLWALRPQPYAITTAPGERRELALDDGSRIVLNGATRLTLDKARPRFAQLEQGEAMFLIRHDDADPFIVETGDVQLVDAGTAFNVIRSGSTLDVAVAEGAVIVNPDAENVRLDPGRRATIAGADGRITLADVAIGPIGSWRAGQLSFTDASMTEVAQALERSLGARIAVDPAIAARRFSGVLQLRGRDGDAMPALAMVLGARAVRRGQDWELAGADGSR